MLVDEDSWAIRYLVTDTSNWWLGHPVLIARRWIQNVSWSEETVSVNLTRQAVKDAPPYDAEALDRILETNVAERHGRFGHRAGEANANPMDPVLKSK